MDNVILEYEWSGIGKLSIIVEGNQSATFRYFPSESAIEKAVNGFRTTPKYENNTHSIISTHEPLEAIPDCFVQFQRYLNEKDNI